jgi:hypothetical protein
VILVRDARIPTSRRGVSGVVCVALALLATTLIGVTPVPAATLCSSPPAVFPESGLVPGTIGTGYTTLSGSTPTIFTVEVLGTIPDGFMLGLDAIVVQITGPQSFLDETGGIFFGMSGSPVYVDGALAGAVSAVFEDATFGVLTPAQSMVDLLHLPSSGATAQPARSIPLTGEIRRAIARVQGVPASAVTGTFEQLPLPLGVSGLSDAQIQQFQTTMDEQGMNVLVYSGGSTTASPTPVNPTQFTRGQPVGTVISSGDASIYATGTATATCGTTILAYGHPVFYDAPGAVSLGLSGASGMMIVKSVGWPGYRFALLTEPRGQIVQDRFAGEVGIVGVTPPSVPITSTLSSPDTGLSRSGMTDAIHTWGWWLEDIVWTHVASNIAAVIQRYGGGTSNLAWTIQGTRPDGTAFTVTNRGMFWSDWDAGETVWKLLNAIDALQFNQFEKVTFTGVDIAGSVTQQQLEGDIVRVRTSSALQPTLRSRNVTKVKAGHALTVEVTLAPLDGSPDVVSTLQLRIPRDAHGTRAVKVRGGRDSEWFDTSYVGSLDELLAILNGGSHQNDLIASGFGASQTKELDWIVDGSFRFSVRAV